MAAVTPIGQLLVECGKITLAQRDEALRLQQRSGARLGDILVGEGMIGYRDLYTTLATHLQLEFVDLIQQPADYHLSFSHDLDQYLSLGFLPIAQENSVAVIATCEPSEALQRWCTARYGRGYRICITSPFDIRRSIEQRFAEQLTEDARHKLARNYPEISAIQTTSPAQRMGFGMLLLVLCAFLVHAPLISAAIIMLFCHALFTLNLLAKAWLFWQGIAEQKNIRQSRLLTPALDEHQLPVYTLLLPLYKEPEVMKQLYNNIQQLDYPKSKLDIKLILEADDFETYNAAIALNPPRHWEIIRVPLSFPRTKAKACNYALNFARGSIIAIFDAEDRPQRSQLKRAAASFASLNTSDVVCLQSRLNHYNANKNLITKCFEIEYTALFNFTLAGLQRLHLPIPLGGTSNHIQTEALRQACLWDPHNVTEDADLGIRLAIRSGHTQLLDATTLEGCPDTLNAWMKQRGRWVKGYLQTWLVHARNGGNLRQRLGWRGFACFHLFFGLSSLIFLASPPLWVLSYGILRHGIGLAHWAVEWLSWLTILNLTLYLTIHWAMAWRAAHLHRRTQRRRLWPAVLAYPIYCLLPCIASYRAVLQLMRNPYYWDKTDHKPHLPGA